MTAFRLIAAAVLPALFAVLFYLLEKKTRFSRASYAVKQIAVGVVFGCIAVLATEFGIPVDGAVLNVRNAAPLTAGLLFGGPAGIIAGVIGGVHRWLSVFWGAGAYTRLACSLATVLAGVFGAGCRKFMFDNKKPSWFYGLALGVTTEVLHMLLLFLTNMDDIYTAFSYVTTCAIPMIVANSLSVALSLLAVALIGKEKLYRPREKKQIAQTFQLMLLACVLAAFILTSVFTYALQTQITSSNADYLLSLNIEDVRNTIRDASDQNLLKITNAIADEVSPTTDSDALHTIAAAHNVSEINLVNRDGIISATTHPAFLGYDMSSGEQSAEFMALLSGTACHVQDYRPTSFDSSIWRKYAGVALADGGFVQVGYDAACFQSDIAEQVVHATNNRHIGQNGSLIICDTNLTIVSDLDGKEGENLANQGGWSREDAVAGERFSAVVYGVESYCMYTESEGYYIIASLPISEAMFPRNIAVYVIVFMEVIVFAALFIHIYFLIKRLVVDNIHKVNTSLAEITGGNLNVTVDVRGNEEFASLSDDINSTVATLKHYIAEAAARIDKELEFAKSIQHSALPSVFPPYPNRKDFDIYAMMNTAKEVGGDFYDFYLLDNDRLGFLIADVSGKGIPAAMFMMTAKATLKSLAESGMDVDEIFTRANEKLCEENDAGMFVTAWLGIVDLHTGLLSYANAGHNPPLICHKNGSFEYLRVRPNFVLAGMEGARYRKNTLQLLPGDTIYLYTDGVTEATNQANELFGEERLEKALNTSPDESVQSRCDSVMHAIDAFVGDTDQFDDITMLSVKFNYYKDDERIAVNPAQPCHEAIWEFINGKLKKTPQATKKVANRVQIAVDELYANIVNYSGASLAEVLYQADDKEIVLTVKDNGMPFNPLETKKPDITLSAEEREVGGLGIHMVKEMASSVRYEYEDGFNVLTVSFKLI